MSLLPSNIHSSSHSTAAAAAAAEGQDHQGRAPEAHSQDLKHSGAQGALQGSGLSPMARGSI